MLNLNALLPEAKAVQTEFCLAFDCPKENIFCFNKYFLESITFEQGRPVVKAYSIYRAYENEKGTPENGKEVFYIFGWTIQDNEIVIDDEPVNTFAHKSYADAEKYLLYVKEVQEV